MQSTSKTSPASPPIAINQDDWIPEGFIAIIGPNNEKYIVPEFMIPQLEQDFQSTMRKDKLGAFVAPGIVSNVSVNNLLS